MQAQDKAKQERESAFMDMLEKFDRFLSMFDAEELIKDGVSLVKFHYKKNGIDQEIYLTPDDIKEAKKNA